MVILKRKTYFKKIGEKFKELRLNAGYSSIEKFANHFRVSRHTVTRIEKGDNMQMDTLIKFIHLHKISMEEFFKGIK